MSQEVFRTRPYLKNQSGFTIMEILVAVMLLAISFTIIMQQFSLGLKNISMSETYTQAVSYARNIMEETFSDTSIKEGQVNGVIKERYAWQRNIKLLSVGNAQSSLPLVEYEINVSVSWQFSGKEKRIELTTMKVMER